MKLDQNMPNASRWGKVKLGKYVLINVRKVNELRAMSIEDDGIGAALDKLKEAGVLELGGEGNIDEFFVIKLRDSSARAALDAYAANVAAFDPELAEDVKELAQRSGIYSPFCKEPD